MPEFDNDDQTPFKQILVKFASESSVAAFARLIEQKITMETKGVWYPPRNLESIRDKAYVADAD
jgi:hypothetical protein